jgi:hypothetical protein
MKKVYIIIVNHNTFKDTIECLESVLKSNYSNFQIFVVDNSSDDASVNQLLNWITGNNPNEVITNFKNLVFPLQKKPLNYSIITETGFSDLSEMYENCITIVKARNNGFAAANNVVLKHLLKNAPGPYLVWLLNNDTVVEKNALSILVDHYRQSESKKMILASKLRYYDKPEILQAVAGYYNKWIGKHFHIGEGQKDAGQFDNYKPGKNNYIVGASIFLPQSFLEQAGLMCEDYFLYFEELDWMQAGIKNGYTMDIVPGSVVYHKEGSSIIKHTNNDTSVAEYYSITNRVRFIKKWYPYCLITVLPGVVFALAKRSLLGKFNLVKKTFVAVFKILFIN